MTEERAELGAFILIASRRDSSFNHWIKEVHFLPLLPLKRRSLLFIRLVLLQSLGYLGRRVPKPRYVEGNRDYLRFIKGVEKGNISLFVPTNFVISSIVKHKINVLELVVILLSDQATKEEEEEAFSFENLIIMIGGMRHGIIEQY